MVFERMSVVELERRLVQGIPKQEIHDKCFMPVSPAFTVGDVIVMLNRCGNLVVKNEEYRMVTENTKTG